LTDIWLKNLQREYKFSSADFLSNLLIQALELFFYSDYPIMGVTEKISVCADVISIERGE